MENIRHLQKLAESRVNPEREEKARKLRVANTIINQLGGHRFSLMTGAKNYAALDNGVQFSLPSRFAKNGINKVRIRLTSSDTYDVDFIKVGNAPNFKITTVASHKNAYAEDLRSIFTKETGLDVNLGTFGRNK